MAGKKTSAAVAYSSIEYNIETHCLQFVGKGDNKTLMFMAVPPDVFYGMPSGVNVQNFIDLKLKGRYTMVEVKPPPYIEFSLVNREVTLYRETEKWMWKVQPGDPLFLPEDPVERFNVFNHTFGQRAPSDKVPRIFREQPPLKRSKLDEDEPANEAAAKEFPRVPTTEPEPEPA